MNHAAKLFTDEAYKDHTSFWKSALEQVSTDFHFRQPWLSYASDHTSSVCEVVPIVPEAVRLINEIRRGQDIGVLVVLLSTVAFLLHKYMRLPVLQIDLPLLKQRLENDYIGSTLPFIAAVDSNA